MPGRAPQPTAIRQARGNPGKRGYNHAEPKPALGAVMPEDLLEDSVASATWDRMVVVLEQMRVLTQADADALAQYCRSMSRFDAAQKKWKGEGEALLVQGAHGGAMVRNPLIALMQDEEKNQRAILQQFGMTPSSRTKVAGNSGRGAGDEFDELQAMDDQPHVQ